MPYFEVNLNIPGTTEMTFTNAEAAPVLAHIVFWTNLGFPSLDFDIFLSGFDTLTLDIDAFFRTGLIPTMGPSVSNQGPFSEPNQDFPGCSFPLPSQLPASLLAYVQAAHIGQELPPGFGESGLCVARESVSLAQGYITLDVVNECSLSFPGNPQYFSDGGAAIASNRNSLWGSYRTPVGGFDLRFEEPLVHIEARDSVQNGFWDPGDFTFYGNLEGGSAADNREPLATSWGVHYEMENGVTRLVYWRDSGVRGQGFTCGSLPAPYPLSMARMIAFDEEENTIELPDFGNTLRWNTGFEFVPNIGPLFEEGWLFLDFSDLDTGPLAPVGQAFVTTQEFAPTAATSLAALPFDSALAPRPIGTRLDPVFADDFESGDTSAWTLTFPLGGFRK